MTILSGFLDDAYTTFLKSPVNCCFEPVEQVPSRGREKHMRIEQHQPRRISSPIAQPQARSRSRGAEWMTRSKSFASRASSRGSFSVRRQLNAYNGFQPRRPQIGAPSDFRHVEYALPQRREEYRPLELSIYTPEHQLSPIMPHFATINDLSYGSYEKELPFPPAALLHTRSESALSHRIPRKPVRSSSRTSSEWTAQFKPRPESLSAQELLAALENDLPKAPPPARLRSKTEPPSYERVKSALHEKYELEQRLKDIEETIEERKSIYLSSRPTSRATSRASHRRSIYSDPQEPMPTPPIAPSFAQRVASPRPDQRPKTAPSKTVHIPVRLTPFTEASAAFTTPSPSSASSSSHIEKSLPMPPPPLPLVLKAPPPHPPLRKKKSFSRVSNWLFLAPHSRNTSLDSVTNTPKPVTSREGFYQCVDLRSQVPERSSIVSVSTISTLESELDDPTPPAEWTPNSSPGRDNLEKETPVAIRTLSMDSERNEKSVELTRMRTFGEKEMGENERWRMHVDALAVHPPFVPGRNSVGVAF